MTRYIVNNSVRSRAISGGCPLGQHPHEDDVLDIQQAQWDGGLNRAAGPTDILIAACALANDAVVPACDRDIEHIAKVCNLRTEYLAPTGST